MPTFALIGYPLSHSFSQRYFTEKFKAMGLAGTHRYVNFEIESLDSFAAARAAFPDLRGCNVTIPYKQAILALLDSVDPVAERIGAVNTIRIVEGKTRGFNTDLVGFKEDLLAQLAAQGQSTQLAGTSALILGTGGASLAVREALLQLKVEPLYVSRRSGTDRVTYQDLDARLLDKYRLIVNTTPLGTYPAVDAAPALPYTLLGSDHFCYDLVYNPLITRFMQLAKDAGAGTANGLGMLHLQAEASWQIWNEE